MASGARKAARQGTRELEKAEDHEWMDHAVRFGLIAYGVVHLLVAYLALRLALGEGSGKASSTGALHELAQQPFGAVGLWLVAVGMLLLVVWRVLEVVAGHTEKDGRERVTARLVSALKGVLYASLGVTAIRVAVGDSSSGGGSGGGSGAEGETGSGTVRPLSDPEQTARAYALMGDYEAMLDTLERQIEAGHMTKERAKQIIRNNSAR